MGFSTRTRAEEPFRSGRRKDSERHIDHMRRMAAADISGGPVRSMTPGGAAQIVVYGRVGGQAPEWTSHVSCGTESPAGLLDAYRWAEPHEIGEPLASRMKADPETKIEMTKLPLVVLKKTDKFSMGAAMPVLLKHRDHIANLIAEGKVRAAGPFLDEAGNPGAAGS